MRALAVTTKERVAVVPDLPTIAETVPGFDVFVLVRFLCAGEDAAGDHRQDQRRHQRRAGRTHGQVAVRGARRRSEGLDAGRTRCFPEVWKSTNGAR